MTSIGDKKITHIYKGSELVANDVSESKYIKIGDEPISFVYQGNELLYPNPAKDGLVLWYDFVGIYNNSVNKEITKDLSGHNIDGFLKNFTFSNGAGYSKEGLILDGVDDYIEVKNHESISNITENITINFLFKYKENTGGFRWLVSNNSDATASTGYGLAYSPSSINPISFRWGGEVTYYNTKPEKNNDYLYTFVISKENSKILFYINGKLVQENIFSGNPKKSDNNLFFGKSSYNNSEVLNGIIKSIQIYNRALSDKEIQHNYQLEKERWNL